jgi:O-acetyl-ADP-ribose deacetylase (regulator of RNase III)
MELVIQRTRITVASGELAFQQVDALIHPTNNFLWFASGFSQALKRQGGENLEAEAIALGPILIGEAVATKAGRLPCKMLIHTAAWGQDMRTDASKIHRAVASALRLAVRNDCETAAIPPVGADVGEFSLVRAVEATFLSIVEHCLHETTLREIRFLATDRSVELFLNNLIQSALSAAPPEGESESKEE